MSLISVAEAAKMLDVSRATAYRMASDHRIPTVRMLKRGVRVHREQLQQMIDAEAAGSIRGAGGVSEETICLIKERTPRTGGSSSNKQMENELDALLALPTSRRQRQ
ncbi:helix-turn-helix domain-containing protein [Pseudomonas petrae]|uniref:helix-turn-helix domain-containing protein n=1 Tax=Pseudomonas petrae TaxID=2912190 RepID=UPI003B00E805